MPVEHWYALGLGLGIGVIFGFLVSTGRRITIILLAGALVTAGLWWASNHEGQGPLVVTLLLAVSVGHVFTVGIRGKIRKYKESQKPESSTY
ncbi:MAG: hypothetical protein FWG15_08555 [Propionibacteriaceae bacterium]|nr:hypothetical protein [Propionibacteriaceae bacterium]